MIPYEELVAALTRWRERNGLPTAPAEFGGVVAPPTYRAGALSEQAEIVDLSDDSGLIFTDSLEDDAARRIARGAAQPAFTQAPATYARDEHAEPANDERADSYGDRGITDAYGIYDPEFGAAGAGDGSTIVSDDVGLDLDAAADAEHAVDDDLIEHEADGTPGHELAREYMVGGDDGLVVEEVDVVVDDDVVEATYVTNDPRLRAELEPRPMAPFDDDEEPPRE
jgi:hypothetical protein